MLELTHDAGWFRPVAWRSAAIAGICVILCIAPRLARRRQRPFLRAPPCVTTLVMVNFRNDRL